MSLYLMSPVESVRIILLKSVVVMVPALPLSTRRKLKMLVPLVSKLAKSLPLHEMLFKSKERVPVKVTLLLSLRAIFPVAVVIGVPSMALMLWLLIAMRLSPRVGLFFMTRELVLPLIWINSLAENVLMAACILILSSLVNVGTSLALRSIIVFSVEGVLMFLSVPPLITRLLPPKSELLPLRVPLMTVIFPEPVTVERVTVVVSLVP